MGPCETKPTEPMVPSGSTYAMASTLWGPNSPQLEKSPVEATRMATSPPFQSSTRISPVDRKRKEYSKSVLRLPSGGGKSMRLPTSIRHRSTG